jgi:hypothetical protein
MYERFEPLTSLRDRLVHALSLQFNSGNLDRSRLPTDHMALYS